MRDCFENHIEAGEEHCDQLQVLVDSDAFYEIEPSTSLPRYVQVKFSFTSTTCDAFPVFLKYSGKQVTSLQLLVLTPDKLEVVNNYVTRLEPRPFPHLPRMSWNSYYEVQLTKLQGVAQKSKTVYVYLTDRQVGLSYGLKGTDFVQVTIREFYLKLIPHKLATFRVAPHVTFSVQVLLQLLTE